jgi:hypothetical protein
MAHAALHLANRLVLVRVQPGHDIRAHHPQQLDPIATPDWEACHTHADATAELRYDRDVEIVKTAGDSAVPSEA